MTGGDLTGNSGQLASPLYPRNYPHNSDYRWAIIVDIGKKVRIEFTDMDIETGTTCGYDYLKVSTSVVLLLITSLSLAYH